MQPAAYWVNAFGIQPHPEGGYFAETYQSGETISQSALPGRFSGDRPFSTAIYFLLESHHISKLHRIQSDEVWHFYAGGPLDVFVINPSGELTIIRLGNNPEQGEVFQAVVPAELLVWLETDGWHGVFADRLHRCAWLRLCRF